MMLTLVVILLIALKTKLLSVVFAGARTACRCYDPHYAVITLLEKANMIAMPEILVEPACKAGIEVPDDLENFDVLWGLKGNIT